jgi:type I restriction enzyme M protein
MRDAAGDSGEFYTPRAVVRFVVEAVDPRLGETVLDPACGTGGFLVSAYKRILKNHTSPGSEIPGDLLTHAQRQRLYANLTGYDITDLMVKLTKVNLFLHGFPEPAVHIYDTLSNDARWNEKADLILANPPFMTPKGGVTPHTRFRIAAKKAEVLFTDYIAEHLAPEGRAGIIVPNGIVATTQNAYVKLRRFLVEDSLVAVVSLPAGVFKPYSGVKTSVLILDKALARRTKKVLFLKIAADGFDLGDKRNPVEADDLPEAERLVKLWLAGTLDATVETPLAWKAVQKKELLSNRDLSLSAEKYFGEKTSNGGDAPRVKLGEIASLEYGKPLKEENRTGFGFPVFGSNGVVGRHSDFIVTGPFIIVGRKGSAGEVTWSDENGWPIDTTYYALPKRDDVDLKYLYLALKRASLHQLVEQAGVPGLNRNDAYECEIPLPPLDEQRRIVAELDAEAAQMDVVRALIPRFEAKIQRVLDRVWGVSQPAEPAGWTEGLDEVAEEAAPAYTAGGKESPA